MLETKATLRIFSATRPLSELKGILGQPSRGFSKGDHSGPGGSSRQRTFWAWESRSPQTAGLESHLQEVLVLIDSIKAFDQIRKDCEIDVFCMLSTTNGQGGAVVPHPLMARMAALELDLVFDVYGDSEH